MLVVSNANTSRVEGCPSVRLSQIVLTTHKPDHEWSKSHIGRIPGRTDHSWSWSNTELKELISHRWSRELIRESYSHTPSWSRLELIADRGDPAQSWSRVNSLSALTCIPQRLGNPSHYNHLMQFICNHLWFFMLFYIFYLDIIYVNLANHLELRDMLLQDGVLTLKSTVW